MKDVKGFILMGVAACICMLLLITPALAANVVIGGDSTDVGTIIFVSPKPGDTATANGTAVMNTLKGITDNADTNKYLIKLGPGTYDLSTGFLQMKEFVSIEGSGEEVTRITAARSYALMDVPTAAVMGVNNAGLRFLAVENTGTGESTVAIMNVNASPSLIHVTAIAAGGGLRFGVFNLASSSPTMTNVTVTTSGGTYSYGVINDFSSPTMTNVTVTASGGTDNRGVYNNHFSSPTMTNVTVTASGGTNNYGVYNNDSSSPTMMNVTADASGATDSNYGVYNNYSSPTMTNVTVTASGGTNNYGVYNNYSSPTMTNVTAIGKDGASNYGMHNYAAVGAYTILVDRSSFEGTTNSISNFTGFTLRIGASKLTGGAVNASGTWTCVNSYDGDTYTTLNNLCQ